MSERNPSTEEHHQPGRYEIRLKGHVDDKWADWFDGLTITRDDNGETRLHGSVVDQAALHGVLRKVRDLGLPLLSVMQIEPEPADVPDGNTDTDHKYSEQGDKHMNTRNLIRWAGVSAMVAGMCYVVVGIFHPPNVLSSVTTTQWAIVHVPATAMCFFGILGMVGLYTRQAEQSGWLGRAGFVLLSLWFALILGFSFVETFILPQLATESPTFVDSFLGVLTSTASEMNLGALPTLWTLTAPLYMLGGLLFGIATFRAGLLPRWAGVLLAVGTAMAPVAALLPLEHQPKVALPVGIALAWLGYALWSERRKEAAQPVPGTGNPQLGRTVAE